MFQEFLGALEEIVTNVTSPAACADYTDGKPHLAVQELSGAKTLELIDNFPAHDRTGLLVLYGPLERDVSPTSFNLILRAPAQPPFVREKLFSLVRTDELEEAEKHFNTLKECLIPLINIDSSNIGDFNQLGKICEAIRKNPGWTAVHLCAAFNFHQCLHHPSILSAIDIQEVATKKTPLHIAIEYQHLETVVYLLDLHVQLDLTDDKLNNVIHTSVSVVSASPVILKRLLTEIEPKHPNLKNAVNGEGSTPLHIACRLGNTDQVQILLKAGANVNIPSRQCEIPPDSAVINRTESSVCSVEEIIRTNKDQLLTKNLKDGGTPLHWATGPELLVPLLELGCDPNVVDNHGRSALHNAVKRQDLKSALLLLAHHGSAEIIDDDGNAPLHLAAKLCAKDLIKALIVFRADVNRKNRDGFTSRHLVCTSGLPEADECLFYLDRVGAKRCSQELETECKVGCSALGDFCGTRPENVTISVETNLVDQTLGAFCRPVSNVSASATVKGPDPGRDGKGCEQNIGGRLLCLDGGGIRGLVLIQVMMVLEEITGRKIPQLFDWISGTSTGGMVTLGLATGKSLLELQALYLRLKDAVFAGMKPYSAEKMDVFLKNEFGVENKMCDIARPRVMVTTTLVDKRPAELHLFRNYQSPSSIINQTTEPELEEYVWKVAKWTGAAPTYFRLDGSKYVDGGLISNNPTLDALTEMSQYESVMRSKGDASYQNIRIPTAVVSIGCGIQPEESVDPQHLDLSIPRGFSEAVLTLQRVPVLLNLLIDQATQTEGQIVERARAWCSGIGAPFFRFSPQFSQFVDLDETKDEVLVHAMWLTRAYAMSNETKLKQLKQALLESAPPGV